MNFDAKHLIRWGIPGWILIITLIPYLFFTFNKELILVIKEINALALGAFLTIIGVPLGFLLNQIHHALFWVLINNRYKDTTDYFKEEIVLDNLFMFGEKGDFMHERYRYLLSRKHELGGLTISLGISSFVILIIKINESTNHIWSWIYLIIIVSIFLLILKSRNYSSANLDEYYNQYLEMAKHLPEKKSNDLVKDNNNEVQ